MASWTPDLSQEDSIDKDFAEYVNDKGFEGSLNRVQFHKLEQLSESSSKSSFELLVVGCQYATVTNIGQIFTFDNLEDASEQFQGLCDVLASPEQTLSITSGSVPKSTRMVARHLGENIAQALSQYLDLDVLSAFLFRIYRLQMRKDGKIDSSNLPVAEFMQNLQNCRFVQLDNDEVAIAPGSVQVDDVICVFQGAYSACILRRVQDRAWRLICGACPVLSSSNNFNGRKGITAYMAETANRIEEFKII